MSNDVSRRRGRPVDPPVYDRHWFTDQFRRILTGWYQVLRDTSDTGVVWEPAAGVRTENFTSAGGKQVDGVTRMMPALAAWASLDSNTASLTLDDGQTLSPRTLLRDIFTCAFDPEHPHYWQPMPSVGPQQRQVESSIVAWSLWLSRDWLLPQLDDHQITCVQNWLADTAGFDLHATNWALFVAVNEAVRYALARRGHRGFVGRIERVRKVLQPLELNRLPDGWTWDHLGHGIDYYNFWVYGSHDLYLLAILGDEAPPEVEEAVAHFSRRERDLPYLIDAAGRNVLMGRSLPYRWGWLTGSVAAHYTARSQLPAGLVRYMLGCNLRHWLDLDSLNDQGVLRERLTAPGSEGARSNYINCGHPYWGMQAFLCLAMPEDHPFWRDPLQPTPIEHAAPEVADFLEPRRGPGLVFQGIARTGEVRLWNLRNHNRAASALYGKYVYATGFPANAVSLKQHSLGDNQMLAVLADGAVVAASEVKRVDVADPRALEVGLLFTGPGLIAWVLTRIEVDGETYRTCQRIDVRDAPAGAHWIEGGFALGLKSDDEPELHHPPQSLTAWAATDRRQRAICSRGLEGWTRLAIGESVPVARAMGMTLPDVIPSSDRDRPNIIFGRAVHALLSAPVVPGRTELKAEHTATLAGQAICDQLDTTAIGDEAATQ